MTKAYRVLIVEDEVMLALELEAELQALGVVVCGIASNIKDAVALVMTMEAQPRNDGCSSGGPTGRYRHRAMAPRDVWASDCFCDRLRQ